MLQFGLKGVSSRGLPYFKFNRIRRQANQTRRRYCPSMEHKSLNAISDPTNGNKNTRPQIQDNKAVPSTPAISPPINSPTMGMMGMFQNIAGRLMPL